MKVLSFNANGLLPKLQELRAFLIDLDIDIALIQETHLSPNLSLPRLHPYAVVRKDREMSATSHGGVAILIHKRLSFTEFKLPPLQNPLECAAAIIPLNGAPVAFVSLYLRPSVSRFDHDSLAKLFSSYPRVFVGGDYNAKHLSLGCRITNNRGASLLTFLEISPLPIQLHIPEAPTHYNFWNNFTPPDILDFALSVNIPSVPTIDVVNDLSSDHLPVIFTFPNSANYRRATIRPKVQWRNFHTIMEATLPSSPPETIPNPHSLEQHVSSISEIIQNALRASSTPAHLQRRSSLPSHILEAIRERRRLRRLWQHTRAPSHKTQFKNAAEKCTTLLFKHRVEQYEEFLSSLEDRDSPWKATRALTKQPKSNSPLSTETGLVFDEREKVCLLAEHLKKHFTTPARPANIPPTGITDEDIQKEVDQCINTPTPMTLPPFTKAEITTAIKNINPRKTPGHDGITGTAILNSPPRLIDHLMIIYNTILSTQHFPSQWKLAEIIVLLKPQKPPTQVSSYRPISLLPILSKIFEKLLLSRIRDVVDAEIRPEQFGFRTGCSTTLQIMRFVSDVSDAINISRTTAAVLIDFKAAFDTVWHLGLAYKLTKIFPPPMVKLLWSYFTERKFTVRSNNLCYPETSAILPISAGVPQGSVLGPVLYSIFINDIPKVDNVSLALYADDTVYYSVQRVQSRLDPMKRQLTAFNSWAATWRAEVNASKCEAIYFDFKRRSKPPPLSIGDTPLPWKTSIKYLGVQIDDQLKFQQHVTNRIRLGRVLLGKLYSILTTRALPVKTKTLVFTMIIRAFLLYAAPVWFPFLNQTYIKKLQGFHNRALRAVGNFHYSVSNAAIQSYLDVPSLIEIIQLTSRKLHDQALTSHRPAVSETFSTPRSQPRRRAVPTAL
jgi:hypothetical protein